MTSRREFLANAFGIALVSATNWPIRADQARSTQEPSNTSACKTGRTAQETFLGWDVFLAPSIPAVTSDLPPGELGCGERKESDDDLRHAWPRRSFLWRQHSSGAISRCPLCHAAGCD